MIYWTISPSPPHMNPITGPNMFPIAQLARKDTEILSAGVTLIDIIDFKFLIRVVLALTIDTLLVNVLLGTYWCSIMYGKGFMFYLTMRFTKNLIQLPINIFLTYNVIGIVKVINNKIYKNE